MNDRWIVFVGQTRLAHNLLAMLQAQDFPLLAVVRYGFSHAVKVSPIPVTPPAADRDIYCRQLTPSLLETLAGYDCDYVLNLCFPLRITKPYRLLPTCYWINVHSSLLPAYRGPAPVFWQLRDGLDYVGMSLHIMDQALDSGPILLQEKLPLLGGESAESIDQRLARSAAGLVWQLQSCKDCNAGEWLAQDDSSAGYQHRPRVNDFTIEPAWHAQRLFNFMRGSADWRQIYPLMLDGNIHFLSHAVDLQLGRTLQEPYRIDGDLLHLQCTGGVVVCKPVTI